MTDQSRIYGGLKSQSDTSRLDDRDAEWENALSQGPDSICGPSFCMCPAPLALLSPCWKEIPLIGCSAQWTSPPEEEVAGGRLKLKPSEPVAEVDCDPFSAFFPNFSPQTYSLIRSVCISEGGVKKHHFVRTTVSRSADLSPLVSQFQTDELGQSQLAVCCSACVLKCSFLAETQRCEATQQSSAVADYSLMLVWCVWTLTEAGLDVTQDLSSVCWSCWYRPCSTISSVGYLNNSLLHHTPLHTYPYRDTGTHFSIALRPNQCLPSHSDDQ